MKSDIKHKLVIPWGAFGLTNLIGITEWRPNHNLEMPPQEQFDKNIKSGAFNDLIIRSLYGTYNGTLQYID